MENSQNPYQGNAPAQEAAGNKPPSSLEDIIDGAIMRNHYGFNNYDYLGDKWLAVKNACGTLTSMLNESGHAGTRAYVTHSEGESGLVQEDYAHIAGFSPSYIDMEFSGGNIVQEKDWEIGLRIRIKKPGDPDANENGYIYKTISLNDPHLAIESHEDRQKRSAQEVLDRLVENGASAMVIAQYRKLDGYLQDSASRYRKARNIGKAAKKLLNSRVFRNDEAAQQNVGSMIMLAYGPGRYQFGQRLVTEFTTSSELDDNGLPRFKEKRMSERSRELVNGHLRSVVVLPRLESRRKILVPKFTIDPIGRTDDRTLLAPLEDNNTLARMSD